jgi:glycosyltransferase A (GT-A) superfamily protein (DUF2064 family)
MKIALAIFVKTPELSPVKTRLAKTTSKEFAKQFYVKSLLATASFALALKKKINEFDIYWAVSEKEGLSFDYWSSFNKIYQGEGDLGARLKKVYSDLIINYDAVFFVGADSPHLSSSKISERINAFVNSKREIFLIGNTVDGGYYIFGGKEELPAAAWENVRYSTEYAFHDFVTNLNQQGETKVIDCNFDIDFKVDLERYLSEKFEVLELEEKQIELINWIRCEYEKFNS